MKESKNLSLWLPREMIEVQMVWNLSPRMTLKCKCHYNKSPRSKAKKLNNVGHL